MATAQPPTDEEILRALRDRLTPRLFNEVSTELSASRARRANNNQNQQQLRTAPGSSGSGGSEGEDDLP
jgi:hypothetical protein